MECVTFLIGGSIKGDRYEAQTISELVIKVSNSAITQSKKEWIDVQKKLIAARLVT